MSSDSYDCSFHRAAHSHLPKKVCILAGPAIATPALECCTRRSLLPCALPLWAAQSAERSTLPHCARAPNEYRMPIQPASGAPGDRNNSFTVLLESKVWPGPVKKLVPSTPSVS